MLSVSSVQSISRICISVLLVFLLFIIFPTDTFAQEVVSCGGPGERACEFCDFATMAQATFNIIIGILVVIAGIIFAIAGLFLIVSRGDNAYREQAKNLMVNTVVGLLLVLVAWLLIDIIMKTLVDEESVAGPWNTIECVN